MALAFVDLSREIQIQDVQNILTSYQLTSDVSVLALIDQIALSPGGFARDGLVARSGRNGESRQGWNPVEY